MIYSEDGLVNCFCKWTNFFRKKSHYMKKLISNVSTLFLKNTVLTNFSQTNNKRGWPQSSLTR